MVPRPYKVVYWILRDTDIQDPNGTSSSSISCRIATAGCTGPDAAMLLNASSEMENNQKGLLIKNRSFII